MRMGRLLRECLKSREIRVGILLLLASFLLMVISPEKFVLALREYTDIGILILLATVVAVMISVAIHYLVPPDFAEKHLSKNKKRYLLYATLLGILTPGPVYAIYPIVFSLKNKGIQNHIIVSYITGQTIIGPARAPFEIGLLGLNFFLYRVMLAVVMGTLAGFLYILFSRRFPDSK